MAGAGRLETGGNAMTGDYNPSDFRVNGGKVVAAWLAAVIFMVVMAATFTF
jgi:hypothetical protein